jgi:hypothetical protein
MDKESNNKQNTDELHELTTALEQLDIQANNIRRRISTIIRNQQQENTKSRKRTVIARSEHRPIQVGDRVVVTNNYKGRRGTKGIVRRTTSTQAYIDIDNTNETIRSYKQNLRRL